MSVFRNKNCVKYLIEVITINAALLFYLYKMNGLESESEILYHSFIQYYESKISLSDFQFIFNLFFASVSFLLTVFFLYPPSPLIKIKIMRDLKRAKRNKRI